MVIELVQRVQNTQVFLRMAAIELRRIAEQAPDIAAELRHVAQQLEAEAEGLACFTLSK
jgi:type II secretory pathway component PulF